MTTSTLSLQFSQKDVFDRLLLKSTVGGTLFFTLSAMVGPVHSLRAGPLLAGVAGAALARSLASESRHNAHVMFAATFPLLALLLGMGPLAAAAVGGVLAGVVACVTSWFLDAQGSVGSSRPNRTHFAATAIASGLLTGAGALIASNVYAWAVATFGTSTSLVSSLFLFVCSGALIGFVTGLGTMPLHLQLDEDPVGGQLNRLTETLPTDFRLPIGRAVRAYQSIGATLRSLPRTEGREMLAHTVTRMLAEMEALACHWVGVEDRLEEKTAASLVNDIAALKHKAHASRDALVQRMLLAAADSLDEERARLSESSVRKERVLAKLIVQSTAFERTRIALLSIRPGHAQAKAVVLNSLNRRLENLLTLETSDADMAATVALEGELEALGSPAESSA